MRISKKYLSGLVDRINSATNSPAEYMTNDRKAAIGHYALSQAYGGYCLHRITSAGGGVTYPIRMGHVSNREMAAQLEGFLAGIRAVR